MADEDRSFEPRQTETNPSRMQGGGMGARELDQQGDPNRTQTATAPDRTEAFDTSLDPTTNADRPSQADFGDADVAHADAPRDNEGGRNVAGINDIDGDLGAGTPANVDIHKLGQRDNPQEAWGESADEGAQFSSNHSTRGVKTEAERGQGPKTRQHTKDVLSRRV
jgi:hypothetical protein